MYTLENNRIRFRLDDAGKVVSLANAETGREYAGGCSLWRIIRQNGAQLEEEVCADTCAIAISQPGPDRLMLRYTRPRAASGEAVAVTARATGCPRSVRTAGSSR